MTPLNCSKGITNYNACLSCRHRSEDECWANMPIAQKLSDILTLDERIAILEDKEAHPNVNIVTISHQDYQQLQRLILSLKEKIESHITKTVAKKKSKYD